MENENQVVNVPNVYFDENDRYFKIAVPEEEIAKMPKRLLHDGSYEYDISDYFAETFVQMAKANNGDNPFGLSPSKDINPLGLYDSDIFDGYLYDLKMDREYCDLLLNHGMYQIVPKGFVVDKLYSNWDEYCIHDDHYYYYIANLDNFFYSVYYVYSVLHGQTPEEFFEVFDELKAKNDEKAKEELIQTLQAKRNGQKRNVR
ncbi:MAG: hypothetical protein IKE75_02080 [Bacilli bacterium]|nr:hypothetical protein [Bacilli bacterium]